MRIFVHSNVSAPMPPCAAQTQQKNLYNFVYQLNRQYANSKLIYIIPHLKIIT